LQHVARRTAHRRSPAPCCGSGNARAHQGVHGYRPRYQPRNRRKQRCKVERLREAGGRVYGDPPASQRAERCQPMHLLRRDMQQHAVAVPAFGCEFTPLGVVLFHGETSQGLAAWCAVTRIEGIAGAGAAAAIVSRRHAVDDVDQTNSI
jgi:hypothetical protein